MKLKKERITIHSWGLREIRHVVRYIGEAESLDKIIESHGYTWRNFPKVKNKNYIFTLWQTVKVLIWGYGKIFSINLSKNWTSCSLYYKREKALSKSIKFFAIFGTCLDSLKDPSQWEGNWAKPGGFSPTLHFSTWHSCTLKVPTRKLRGHRGEDVHKIFSQYDKRKCFKIPAGTAAVFSYWLCRALHFQHLRTPKVIE